MDNNKIRNIRLHLMLSVKERQQLQERMEEVGTANMSAFIRKMALSGYTIRVDTAPLKELVSLQRRCVNNLKQISKHVDSPEIVELQKSYTELWEQISEILEVFAKLMVM